MKQRLNETHPFWADPLLANWDSSLFGRDPGEALHRLLGQDILAILDFGYSLWFPVNAMCFIACLYYGRARLLLTYFLLWGVCGPLGQVIASSARPMFWPLLGYGNRFDQMIAGLSFGPIYGAKYLWLTYTDESMRFGAGIAAVPSLHVAGAVWVALNTYRTRLYAFGLSYLLCVSIGSVALSWHYAVDGIIGAGCTFLMLAAACLYPFGKTNDTAPDSVTPRDDQVPTADPR